MRAFIYTMDIEQSLSELGANAQHGLSEEIAETRLVKHGKNEFGTDKKRPLLLKIIDRFKDIPLLLLAAASVLAAAFGEKPGEMIVILLMLIINILITIAIESRTAGNKKILKKASGLRTRVRREDEIKIISARNVVVGDIIVFDKGDVIPADLRLIKSRNLKVDESFLTDLKVETPKDATVVMTGDCPVENRCNIVYMGSIITCGCGEGVVYATGKNTETGRNAVIKNETDSMSTPMTDRLSSISKSLSILFMIICIVMLVVGILYDIFDIGYQRGLSELVIMLFCLYLAVAPGGIAEVIKSIMISGISRTCKSGIVIKNLSAAETMGSINVICTGKTGMFTQNIMMITQVADCENTYEVTGVGYKPKGHVSAEIMITRNIALMSEIVVLCNNAAYDKKHAQISGDPTEGAMLVFGVKLGHDKHILDTVRPRIREIPFDSKRKMMSTYNRDGDRVIMYTKGAAEEIIKNASYAYLDGEIVFMSDAIRMKLMAQNDAFSARGLRVLACAYKVYTDESEIDNDESNLIYVGMMGLADQLREDIIPYIKQCRSAGITIKMITGDHRNTAGVIAETYGLFEKSNEILNDYDIDALTDEQLSEKVKTVNVFTRVTPEQKLRIISAIKADSGNSIAVTGEVYDDIIYMEKADIGISVDITGCGAVNNAADVKLSDNSIMSIVAAVKQSRTIYANVRKTLVYALSRSIGMLVFVFITIVFGLPLPLKGSQLLLLVLLTGSLPALAIGMERSETEVLKRKPRNPEETILSRSVMSRIITRMVFIFLGSLAAFLYGLYVAVAPDESLQYALAMSMCLFTAGAGGILAAYSSKTDCYASISRTVIKNKSLNLFAVLSLLLLIFIIFTPGINTLFAVISLRFDQIFICFLIISLIILFFEVSKPGEKQ